MAFVNYEKRYIFIHNIKTAGTSIRELITGKEVLGAHCCALHLMQHYASRDEERFWDRCFKFGFVRNPYEWVGSTYSYILRHPNHPQYHIAAKLSVYQFVEWMRDVGFQLPRPHGMNRYMTQKDYFYIDGFNSMDYIGRYEDLHGHMLHVLGMLGIKARPIEHLNNSGNTGLYVHRYDDKTKLIIGKVFDCDFKAFGYAK